MDIFHAITAWLDEAIMLGVSSNYWLFVLFVFLVCVGEAVFIAGLLVPSLPILLLVGSIISAQNLNFWPIFLAATAGGIFGDAISYWIGFLLKDRVKTTWPFRNYLPLIARGEVFFQKHGGKAIFIGRFITGLKAVVPGIAGMLGMNWGYFTFINTNICLRVGRISHPARHVPHRMAGFDRLSMELVIIYGTIILTVVFLLIHYWKRILLFFAPWMGGYGRSLQERWRKPEEESGH